MATSGGFDTSQYGNRGLTFWWSRVGYDIGGNYTDINWSLTGSGNKSGFYYARNFTVVIDGETVYSSNSSIELWNGTVVASGTKRIYHNNDGSRSFSASASGAVHNYSVNCTGNGSWNLDVIPRYASFIQYDLIAESETAIQFVWGASDYCDAIQYSLNGGAWINGMYPITRITGLSAGVQYNVKLRIKRQDSQLWTESVVKYVTTYDYPHILSVRTNELIIGEKQKLTLYNPLNRNVVLTMNKDTASGTQLYNDTINGDSVEFTPNSNILYESIPDTQSGNVVYSVEYIEGNELIKRSTINNYKYKIKGDEIPTFEDFEYADINNSVTDITGNNQILVKGLSLLQVIISSENKMIANNLSNPNKYTVNIDTLSQNINYDSNDVMLELGTVENSGNKRLTVTAYDSRILSKEVYKDITVLDYNKPVINISATRLNNFENETTLKVSGSYTQLNINNENKNIIDSVQYRYRENNGVWSDWINISTTVNSDKFTCNDVILSLDNTKSFEFEVKASDRLTTNTNTSFVDVGEAIFFISSNKKTCYINGQEVLEYDLIDSW